MMGTSRSDSVLDAALDCLRRGWSIVPMKMQQKRPAVRWKRYQRTPATEADVRKWYGNGDGWGVAVIFGDVSGGLAQRDFDDMASYERWATDHPELAATLPTVKTSRGCHVLFTAAPGSVQRLREANGKPEGTGAIHCGDGELRAGCGCYSVLPPSIHPSGHVYRWLTPLPDGELPIVDPAEAGFVPLNREYRDNGEDRRHKEGELVESSDSLSNLDSPPIHQSCLRYSLDSLPSLLSAQVLQAIERTIPTSGGRRHRAVFDFARELRALPELAEAPAKALEPIVREWHKRALPYIKTRAWEETWFDFAEAWGKVKYPTGQGPLDMAFQRAVATDMPEVARQYDQPQLRLLVALCRELQRLAGMQPFYLSTREAGRLLDMTHVQASHWLRGLMVDGLLAEVEKGKSATGKASRYRYLATLD